MIDSYKSLGARLSYRYAIGDHLFRQAKEAKGSVTAIEAEPQEVNTRPFTCLLS